MHPHIRALLGEKEYRKFCDSGEFRSMAVYNPHLDFLLMLERDCSYVAMPVAGSNIELLREPHGERIIGVKITQFSHMVPACVIEALCRDD